MPRLVSGEKVICGYDQGLGEVMYICDSLIDMQRLYDAYAKGGAIQIHWYVGPDPGFIMVLAVEKEPSVEKEKKL